MGIMKRQVGNFTDHFILLHESLSNSSHNLTVVSEYMQICCRLRRNSRVAEFKQNAAPAIDKFTIDGIDRYS